MDENEATNGAEENTPEAAPAAPEGDAAPEEGAAM